ncbi:hypothetical protein TrVGV298_002660 [Trichoderma virens]|nr:hypothetical protein TrVGV298_002660 [Trichoderma virens]
MDNTFAQMPQTDDEMVELIKLVVEVVRKDQLAGDLREFQKQEEFEFKTLPRHKERMAEIDRWMSVSRAQQQKSKRENPSRFDWGDCTFGGTPVGVLKPSDYRKFRRN